jgi:hypothetical protein
MADSNRIRLSFAEETTFGVKRTGTVYEELRILSESLKSDLTNASSDEIHSRRDIRGLNKTDQGVSGSVNCNLYSRYGFGINRLIGHSLMSGDVWTDSNSLVTVASADACFIHQGNQSYTLNAGTWDANPVVGQWVYISGAANAASNGFHKVATVTGSTSFTVEEALGSGEAAAVLTIKMLPQVKNGSTLDSMTFQREYTDLGTEVAFLTGCVINGMSIDASGTDTVKANFDVLGLTETSASSEEALLYTAGTNPAMTATDGVQFVRENTADITTTSFQFQASNNLRKKYLLGTLGPSDFNEGDFEVTGSMQMYFETATAYDKFLNQTVTSLSIGISGEESTPGGTYIFDFPKVKFTDAQRVAGGRNQDIIADISWQALYDTTEECTMKIAHYHEQ